MRHISELADVKLVTESGEAVTIGDIWNERSTLFVMLRHFGCMFCSQQVRELASERERLSKMGTQVVVVGHGTPNFIEGFKEHSKYDGKIFTDPYRELYKRLNLTAALSSTFNLKTLGAAINAFKQGARQGKTGGNVWQQGGTFGFSDSGDVFFEYKSQFAGDHPKFKEIFAALG